MMRQPDDLAPHHGLPSSKIELSHVAFAGPMKVS